MGLYKCYIEGSKKEFLLFAAVFSVITIGWGTFLVFTAIQEMSVWPKRRHGVPRMECMSNEIMLGNALRHYDFPNRIAWSPASGHPEVSWRVLALNALDNRKLFRRYDLLAAWDEPQNFNVAAVRQRDFQCPANYYPTDTRGRWYTAFAMPTGPHTFGANPAGSRFEDITDGIGNTLLLVEASGSQIVWTEPRDVNIATQPTGINLKGSRPGYSAGWLSSYHSNGVNIVMADGSADSSPPPPTQQC